MPIQVIYKNNKKYYKYGESGKVYPTRAEAERQAQAIHAAGWSEKNKQPKGK